MSYPIYGQTIPANTGTDAPVRNLAATQQPQPAGELPAYVPPFNITDDDGFPLPQSAASAASNPLGITGDDEGYPLPSTSRGVGTANDDNTNRRTPSQVLNTTANGPITAQPNVLDQYASYTYSLSWYILTPAQFNGLADAQININQWTLLMQSGGAQANVNDNGTGGRSPYFSLDYYMDNMVLETKMPGGGAGATLGANLGGKIEFTVTEPNGITLPNNLAQAYQDAIKNATGKGESENYAQALYCMVIRFFGYDDAGNLIQAGRAGNQNGTSSGAAPRAVVQKIYPFAITNFDFRIANRIIEYKIMGDCPAYAINASSRRGSIPSQFELVGKTVGDILAGNGSTGTTVTTGSSAGEGRGRGKPEVPVSYQRTAVNDSTVNAGVDVNGNFTGETDNPFAIVAP